MESYFVYHTDPKKFLIMREKPIVTTQRVAEDDASTEGLDTN